MSRYRLLPTPDQEFGLVELCAHARFVWNLAVEQHAHWRPGRASAPGYLEQARQLTQARAEFAWHGPVPPKMWCQVRLAWYSWQVVKFCREGALR